MKNHDISHFDLNIKINNYSIERINEFNFLGLTVNSTMTWDAHVSKISIKVARIIGVLNKLKHFLPQYTLRTIYNALITPHLNFGVMAWGFTQTRILKLQKKAVRIITNAKYNAHSEPLFKQLNILRIDHIFKRQCIKFYHKLVNGEVLIFF